eukprot:7270449-Pyramimonas_sp.AAC.1
MGCGASRESNTCDPKSDVPKLQSVGYSFRKYGIADKQLSKLHEEVTTLRTAGKFAEAVSVAQQQLDLAKKSYGEEHPA